MFIIPRCYQSRWFNAWKGWFHVLNASGNHAPTKGKIIRLGDACVIYAEIFRYEQQSLLQDLCSEVDYAKFLSSLPSTKATRVMENEEQVNYFKQMGILITAFLFHR